MEREDNAILMQQRTVCMDPDPKEFAANAGRCRNKSRKMMRRANERKK